MNTSFFTYFPSLTLRYKTTKTNSEECSWREGGREGGREERRGKEREGEGGRGGGSGEGDYNFIILSTSHTQLVLSTLALYPIQV